MNAISLRFVVWVKDEAVVEIKVAAWQKQIKALKQRSQAVSFARLHPYQ
jgi:hypothetical protein